MARTIDVLSDVTSAAASAVSTPQLNTAPYEQVTAWFIGAGAAAPTGCSVSLRDPAGTQIVAPAVTVAIGGASPAVLGAVPAAGVTNALALGPVVPKILATGTGGAASTVRILVLGVRSGAPAD
jgi:hypothetical protein